MTPRELYFILAPLAFCVCLVLALNTIFRHGWRYPYRWYTIVMLYLALCSLAFIPFVDAWINPILHPDAGVLHGMLTSLFAPMLMMAFLNLAKIAPASRTQCILTLFPPFLLYLFCSHYIVDTPFLLFICLAYIAGIACWWCRRICLKVRYQTRLSLDDQEAESTLSVSDITWMRPYAILITVGIILRWTLQTILPTNLSEWVKPQMLLIVLLYIPVILHYEWRHREHRYFDDLHTDPSLAPAADPVDPSPQPMQRKDLRAVKVQMQTRAPLPPNAILPHLTAGPAPTPTVDASLPLHERLAQLEREDQFFLDKELTLSTMAHLLCTDRSTLEAHFQSVHTTFYDYLDRLRTDYAARLIRNNPASPLLLVASQSGFASLTHFNDIFGRIHQTTPDNYRKHAHR